MHWIIYYGDKSTYRDCDGSPEEAPARNVQVIAVEDPDCGQSYHRTSDFYWYVPERESWNGGDIFGLFDYLMQPGWKKVIFGRTIPNDEYAEILSRAMNNNYLPPKSARRNWERKI